MSNEPPINAEQRAAFASWVAGHRPTVEGHCLKCGQAFRGLSKRRYCSPACRQAAYRQKPKPTATS